MIVAETTQYTEEFGKILLLKTSNMNSPNEIFLACKASIEKLRQTGKLTNEQYPRDEQNERLK